MRTLLITSVLVAALVGCTTIDEALLDRCVAAAKEQVQFCVIENDEAACNAAKVALATCKKDASNQANSEFWQRVAKWIREILIGGILVSTTDASGRYDRANDMLDYIEKLENSQAAGAER